VGAAAASVPNRAGSRSGAGGRGERKNVRKSKAWIWLPLSVLVVAVVALVGSGVSSTATSTTVVSLTFDDGRQTQYSARSTLLAHGMRATFFVNSAVVGSSTSSFRMTWAQLHDLAADGHEIGGHTLTHADLTRLSSSDARREVCDDRTNLLNQGFSPVISFAYPYGAYNSTAKAVVQECGYLSARGVGGVRAPGCSGCAFAETIPPLDPWATRSVPSFSTATTLEMMQNHVAQAENNGGGWVQLIFHAICDACDDRSVSLSQLTAFLSWLQSRAANGTVVQTVGDVISGRAPPPPSSRPRYEATVRTIHPGATRPSRNWTYVGDTLRVRFRNARAGSSDGQRYRVCYTHGRRLVCKNRRILRRSWDAWPLRVTPALAGYRIGRVRRYLEFTWRVDGRLVARKRVRIFHDG
jgi:peptidoglycan/xylan/chitin deacetylase (PgdA/CDA1 family)